MRSDVLLKPLQEAGLRFRPLLVILSALGLGLGLGVFLVRSPLYASLLATAGLGLVLAWWMFQRPSWTVTLFWIAFTVQGTLLSGFVVQGLYYPLYLIMLFNLTFGLAINAYRIPKLPLALYALFLGVVLLSLFRMSEPVDFDLFQRIFIYALGLLAFFQFRSLDASRLLPKAQIAAALIVALWVVLSALQGGFAGARVEIGTDQNTVSGIIALGLIPLFASLMQESGKPFALRRLPLWLGLALGTYAVLLLASRGQTIALAMGLFAIFARVFFQLRRSVVVLLLGCLVGVVLLNLPGSENLTERFSQGDLSSANGRVVLWVSTWRAVTEAAPLEILLGHGFDSNKALVRAIAPNLTSTHNSYLQILFEFGLVGLGLFIAFHLWILWACWRDRDGLTLYALGAITFLLFSSLSVTATDWFLYWIVIGHTLAIGVWKRYGGKRSTRRI